MIEEIVHTRVTKTTSLRISGKALLKLLAASGHEIPPNAKVHFHVPGGGDWSNTDVDVNGDHPVHVTYTLTEESTNG